MESTDRVDGRSSCAYKHCTTKQGENISLFSFPRDPARAKQWTVHCNRRDLRSVPADELNRGFKVCEKHFAPKDIVGGGLRKRLGRGALPTYRAKGKRKAMSSKKDKGAEAAKEGEDALDINDTDLSSLFGNNVEFIIEEESQVMSVGDATEGDNPVAEDDPLKIQSPSQSTDFNSSFKNFLDDKVAKEKARIPLIPNPPRAPKRKLDEQPPKPKENSPPMPELQPNPVLVTPEPNQNLVSPVVVPTTPHLFLINGIGPTGPIPLAIQVNPSGVSYVMQPVSPLIVPTVPVLTTGTQLAITQSTEDTKVPEPRALDKVNILRRKPRVEVIPPDKLKEFTEQEELMKKSLKKKTPEKPVVLKKKLQVELTLLPEKAEEYSAILGAPVSNEYTNISKLLEETKEHLSKATNGSSSADKAEYIMVVDTETNQNKPTVLNDKVAIHVSDDDEEHRPTKSSENMEKGELNQVNPAPSEPSLCFVPNCSLKKGEKVFLFKAPYDEQLLEVWQKCIGRTDRVLKDTDTVCEKHFSKKDIQVLVQHQGTKLMAFPRLKKTALPCVEYFEGCCVPRCGKTTGRMYKFPVTSPHSVQLWLYMLKVPDLPKLPIEKLVKYRVCERHFEPTSFDDKGELVHSAAPTRHVPVTAGKFVEVTTQAAIPKEGPKMPSLKCIFWNCPLNRRQDGNSRIFLFPNDFDRCRQWLRICKRTDMLRATATRTLIHLSQFGFGVCSNHFVEEDYANAEKSQLKRKAYPKVDPSNDDCIVIYSPAAQDQVLTCAVTFCDEGSRSSPAQLSRQKQFPFPNPNTDKERYQIWLRLVSNPKLLKMDSKTIRNTYGVCQKHFEPHFFNRTPGEEELVNVAVPTKNLIGSKTWLFGTKFYHMKIKEYVNKCINADPSSTNNMNWKISEIQDDSFPKSVCTLNENQIKFPGIGHHIEFKNVKRAPFEVFNCSKHNFSLVDKFEQGEMVDVHSAVIIADDNKVQKEVMQNLIDEMKW